VPAGLPGGILIVSHGRGGRKSAMPKEMSRYVGQMSGR